MEGFEISSTDVEFAKRKLAELAAGYDDRQLLRLCESRSRGVIPNLVEGAAYAAAEAAAALQKRTPWSLIRIGDGEGNVLAMVPFARRRPSFSRYRRRASGRIETRHPEEAALTLKYFNRIFYIMDDTILQEAEAEKFAHSLYDAILDADVLGFRSLDCNLLGSDLDNATKGLEIMEIRGILGIMAARCFLEQGTKSGFFHNAVLTSAWIHFGLIQQLGKLFNSANEVLVISGVGALSDEFHRRLGSKLRQFICIPAEGSRSEDPEASHYRHFFPKIIETLRGDLRGVLVLVGAGLLGKIYCATAKRNGAVAVDLGSAFDVLANRPNRPAHGRIDVDSVRWL